MQVTSRTSDGEPKDLLRRLHRVICEFRRRLISSSRILANADLLSSLSPDDEDRILDRLANAAVKWGMETPVVYFLETMKPLAVYLSSLTITVGAPILEVFGIPGYKYAALFQKRDNVERLIRKIEDKAKHRKNVC